MTAPRTEAQHVLARLLGAEDDRRTALHRRGQPALRACDGRARLSG